MDSPQEKAGSTMDGECETPHLLPVRGGLVVTVARKETAPRPTLLPDVVRLVSIWALSTACFFLVSFAIAYAVAYAHDQTRTATTEDCILMYCAAPQEALALLLRVRHRRVRRALACLAVAIIGHYMFLACALGFLFARGPDPGQVYLVALDILVRIGSTMAIFVFPTGDLVSFLALSSPPGR